MFSTNRNERRGFSLTELLVVIGIMALLAVASVPAINALSANGQINQTITEVSGMLEQARQYAVAQNTYVWVVFSRDANSPSAGQPLYAVVLASKDGTDPVAFGAYSKDIPSDTSAIDLLSRVRSFRQIHFENNAASLSANVPSLAGGGTSSDVSSSTIFKIKLPGATTTTEFSNAIVFTPTGQARNGETPVEALDFGLQSKKGSALDHNNGVVMRINGLTGKTIVYRN